MILAEFNPMILFLLLWGLLSWFTKKKKEQLKEKDQGEYSEMEPKADLFARLQKLKDYLSKEVDIENIPLVQRRLFKLKKKYKNKKMYVATNLLESMLENSYPTRGEANDIYNSLEMGAGGLVLAAETAIGKHPRGTVRFLQKMIKTFSRTKL